MSVNEPRSIHAAEDWGVVLQSVPSKYKKEIVKRLQEIFGLDKHEAEQILANMPLILVDNISFGLAARIKKFFQSRGAVAETTNHDMIKKNCFQIVWPQTPDLSFFLMEETKTSEAATPQGKAGAKPAPVSAPEPKPFIPEIQPEMPKRQEPPAREFPSFETKPAAASSSGADSDWARRADELADKLKRIQEEKQQLHAQHAETAEKAKVEFQRQLEKEKQKSEEIARAYEELQKQAQKQEVLSQEGNEWKSKAMTLGEKVRALETDLMQKTSAIEHLIQQKDVLEKRASDFDRGHSDAQNELAKLKSQEQEWMQKTSALEKSLQELTESLRARDGMLAQFERQVEALAEKAQEYEALRQEHAQLAQERATIRKGYDAKLVEQEVRLAKAEEEHRRYRSRMDRKTAAATRELGEWVRGVDTVRQGLQKLILFLGNDSAVLDTEKKSPLRSPLTRGPDTPHPEKD